MLSMNATLLSRLTSIVVVAVITTTTFGQRAEQKPTHTVSVYALKYCQAKKAADVVSELIVNNDAVRLAVDERINSIIVQATAETQQLVRAVLEQMDVPGNAVQSSREKPKSDNRSSIRVRVVWLVTDQGSEIPGDLIPAVEELQRLGVKNLRLAAQTIVLTEHSLSAKETAQSFTVDCRADLDGPVDLNMSGVVSGTDPKRPRLQLSIEAAQRGHENRESLANVQTSIVAPFDHPVILAVKPIGKLTSVFAVSLHQQP